MGAEVGSDQKSEPNVVPLCDILLVLLIIFMVITPAVQKGIDINLPEMGGDAGSGGKSTGIVLTLEQDLSVKINQIPTTIDLLENELRSLYQTRTDKTIFIRADESTSYRDVLRVIDIAKGAGIEVMGVMLERYKTGE
jgi:biopolymer transport protein ExbD